MPFGREEGEYEKKKKVLCASVAFSVDVKFLGRAMKKKKPPRREPRILRLLRMKDGIRPFMQCLRNRVAQSKALSVVLTYLRRIL